MKPSTKKWITGGAVVGLIIAGNLFVSDTEAPLSKITGKEVIDGIEKDGVVKYAYKGAAVSNKLSISEVKDKRTNNSYTEFLSINSDGSKTYRTVSFSGASFYEDKLSGTWHEVEYATTTKVDFDEKLEIPLSRRLSGQVYAATIFSGAGDGQVFTTDSSWDATHDAVTGDTADYTNTTFNVSSDAVSGFDITRAFIPFNTNSIPSNATIVSATVNLYIGGKFNFDNDGDDWINIVQTSQASETQVVIADFDQAGSIDNPTEGSTRIDITSISTGAYSAWTLNATGLGWIKKSGETANCGASSGWTCLGVREGHDAIDSSLPVETFNTVSIASSENTGTSSDPYLDITYTVPSGGNLIIGNGSLYVGDKSIEIKN